MQSSAASAPAVHKILVAVDGSDHAKRATLAAIELASGYKASLLAVCVVAPPALYIAGPVGAPADLGDYFQLQTEDAKGVLNSVMTQAKAAGLDARSEVVRGGTSVIEAIVESAVSENVDLVVIGTRGLGGFKKLLLGSVSSGVIANAPCSVLVVR
jgi:nucleotide-binding universal stress UspA family protein